MYYQIQIVIVKNLLIAHTQLSLCMIYSLASIDLLGHLNFQNNCEHFDVFNNRHSRIVCIFSVIFMIMKINLT